MIPNTFLPLTQTFEPTDESAAAAIVREAGESNTPVYPIGGATRLDYGGPRAAGRWTVAGPVEPRDRLPGGRLDDHRRGRRDAGGTRTNLAERGQRLPIDVPQADRATVAERRRSTPWDRDAAERGHARYLLGLREWPRPRSIAVPWR